MINDDLILLRKDIYNLSIFIQHSPGEAVCLCPQLLVTLYNSHMVYYCGDLRAKIHTNKIFTLQKRVIRIIAGSTFTVHTDPLFQEFSILKLD